MSFFGSDYFKGAFFKNEFFGEPFFQGSYFDDTTIAHGLTGGTNSSTEIGIVLGRVYDGTSVKPEVFTVLVDGVENVVTASVGLGKDLVLTLTSGIAFGETVTVSYPSEPTNNLGILVNEPIANTVV